MINHKKISLQQQNNNNNKMKQNLKMMLIVALLASSFQSTFAQHCNHYGDKEYCQHNNRRPDEMSNSDFSTLCCLIKSKSFTSDKFDIITAGTLGAYFSCEQGAALMDFFTFNDEKIKVVRLLTHRITDFRNIDLMRKKLSFCSRDEFFELIN